MGTGQHGRPDALEAWSSLSAAASTVRTEVGRRLHDELGMTLAENVVLCRAAMSPEGRVRMSDLADMLGVAKSAVTKTADRLETRGWLERAPDRDDRRGVHLVVTPAGMKMFRRAQPAFVDAVSDVLESRLTRSEVRELRKILGKLTDARRGR